MNKKQPKDNKQNNLNKYLTRNKKTEDKTSPPATAKAEGKKKICHSLNQFLHPQQQVVLAPASVRKFKLLNLLKQVPVAQILQKCPKLQQLVQSLSQKAGLSRDIVVSLMGKYLNSPPHCLWSRRYAPKLIAELFNPVAGKKIQEWINSFFEYKNKIVQEDSFLYDIQSEKSSKMYQKIRQNQWQLQALIVRGRPGIGKTAAIRAIAHEMDIDLQQCGNEYNQTKYLKQKNESTQSQSVKTAYTRKPKIQKNAQMITKFLPPVQKEKPKQNKKLQMIHNISLVYPESDSAKFYSELSKCVQLSKIPFILTNSGEKIPKECQKYDLIEFESGSNEFIHQFLWTICHLEKALTINKSVQLDKEDKEDIFNQINIQTQNVKFEQNCTTDHIKDICLLYNYRLDYILTFLEHHKSELSKINVFPLLLDKYRKLNEDQLLEEITFIDFDKIKEPSQKTYLIESVEDHQNTTQDTFENWTPKKEQIKEQMSLSTYVKKMKLASLQQSLDNNGEGSLFSHLSVDFSQWEDHPYTSIRVNVHKGIKESLTRMANAQINLYSDKFKSSLRPSELVYLPMLLKQKRSSRLTKNINQGLKKIYDNNEFCYLSHFGSLLKQG